MKGKQSTLVPKAPTIRDRKMKVGDVTFYPTTAKTFAEIIHTLESVHGREQFYTMASGGKDSMYVTDRLADMGKLKSVVHIRTGVGLAITLEHLKDTCSDRGWPLQVIEPIPKFTYADFVLEFGFPGPGVHNSIMGKLKIRAIRNFIQTIPGPVRPDLRHQEVREQAEDGPLPVSHLI